MINKLLLRLGAIFIATASLAVVSGEILDTNTWREALLVGAVATIGYIGRLSWQYAEDGELTEQEVDSTLGEHSGESN